MSKGVGKAASTVLSIGGLFSKGLFRGSFSWWGLGALALSELGSRQHNKGSHLTDTLIPLPAEGADLPYPVGTCRVGGVLVYTSGKIESGSTGTTKQGGDAGPRISTNCMVLFGVAPSAGITRPLEVKLNELVWWKSDFDGSNPTFALTSGGGGTYLYNTTAGFRFYLGTQTDVDSYIETVKGVGNWTAYPRKCGLFCEDLGLNDFGNSQPAITATILNEDTSLISLIQYIAKRCGVRNSDLDLGALTGINIDVEEGDGFLVSSGNGLSYLKELMMLHDFDLVPVDGVIRAVVKGGASVKTFLPKELRIHVPNSATPDSPHKMADAQAIPAEYGFNFIDVGRHYTPGRQPHVFQKVTLGEAETTDSSIDRQDASTHGSMHSGRALRVATVQHVEMLAKKDLYQLDWGLNGIALAPCDPITIPTADGPVQVVLRGNLQVPFFGPFSCLAPKHDRLIYDLETPPDPPGLPDPPAPDDGTLPDFALIDLHAVYDTDFAYAGYYAAGTHLQPVGFRNVALTPPSGFATASVYRLPERAGLGVTLGALADFAGGSEDWDDANTLTVLLKYAPPDFNSKSDSELLLHGANRCAVESGDGYEIVQFGTASFVGYHADGVRQKWELTHLLRGQRGTESFTDGHAGGDAFLFLNGAVLRVDLLPTAIDQTGDWTLGRSSLAGFVSSTTNFTNHGRRLKAFSCTGLHGARDGSNNLTISFYKRTRYNDTYLYGGTTPVDPAPHDTNRFEIDILNAPGGTVLRTIDVTSTSNPISAAYLATDQTADGLTPGAAIDVEVFRISDTATSLSSHGRGYVEAGTI